MSGRLGGLAIRGANRGPKVTERVPALRLDQDPMPIITEADIRRSRRIAGARRQLERAEAARGARKPEDVLLDLEMPDVAGSAWLTERSAESDCERSVEGDPKGDPSLEGSPEALAR